MSDTSSDEIYNFKVRTIIEGFAGLILAGIVWFMSTINSNLEINQKDLQDLRVQIASQYASKQDLTEIKGSLLRIEDKINEKEDKNRNIK